MPRQYEAIRDKFLAEGLSLKQAKTRAAKIYNSKRKDDPSLPKLNPKHKAKK